MDKRGFIIDKEISPYQVYINQNKLSKEMLDTLTQDFDNLDIKYLIEEIRNPQQNYEHFNTKGIPISVSLGKHQLHIRSRMEACGRRFEIGDIKKELCDLLNGYDIDYKDNFRVVPLSANTVKEEIVCDVVYICKKETEDIAQNL